MSMEGYTHTSLITLHFFFFSWFSTNDLELVSDILTKEEMNKYNEKNNTKKEKAQKAVG